MDATRPYFTANPGDIERSVDQLDLVQMRTSRNGDCVFDARGIVVPVVVVPGLIAVAVLCANGNIILACIDLDASFVEPLFGTRALDGIDLDFIAVPGGDVHRAINVVELDAAVGSDGIGLVKFFRDGSPVIGGVHSHGEHHQRAGSSECGAQPGSDLGMAIHGSSLFLQRLRRYSERFVSAVVEWAPLGPGETAKITSVTFLWHCRIG